MPHRRAPLAAELYRYVDLIVPSLSTLSSMVFVPLLLLGQGCGARTVHTTSGGAVQELILKSGQVIRIVEISADEDRETFELEYMTSLRILEDHQALQYEAEDIWAEFLEAQASAAGARIVYLSPRDDSPPVLGMSFRIEKVGPDKWCKQGGFAYPLKHRSAC